MAARASRLVKELAALERDPPHGVSVYPVDNSADSTTTSTAAADGASSSGPDLQAILTGPEGSPFAGGLFRLDITVPSRYPFEPPKMRFTTKIYHPNIDDAGRICLDLLKMPPAGSWKPALNLRTIMMSLRLLLAEPNPDDPLMADISSEYKHNRPAFLAKAAEWTAKYAMADVGAAGGQAAAAAGGAEADSAAGEDSESEDSASDESEREGRGESEDDDEDENAPPELQQRKRVSLKSLTKRKAPASSSPAPSKRMGMSPAQAPH